jgi:hypothetical protein
MCCTYPWLIVMCYITGMIGPGRQGCPLPLAHPIVRVPHMYGVRDWYLWPPPTPSWIAIAIFILKRIK